MIFGEDSTIEATRILRVAPATSAAMSVSVVRPSPGAKEYPMAVPPMVTSPTSPAPVQASF
jgi:hypothetical protein